MAENMFFYALTAIAVSAAWMWYDENGRYGNHAAGERPSKVPFFINIYAFILFSISYIIS